MSTLTTSLLLLFVLVLAGVFLYNRIQVSRRSGGPLLGPGERPDRGPLAGVSTGIQRDEPRLAGQGPDDPGTNALPGDAAEPMLAPDDGFHDAPAEPMPEWSAGPAATGPSPDADPAPAARPVRERAPAAVLDDSCDCIVEVEFAQPTPGERLIGAAQSFRRAGAKPVVIEALPVEFAPAQDNTPRDEPWEPIEAAQHYSALRAGILLANRHGPLNAMEFTDFIAGVHRLGDQFGTVVGLPDMNRVLEQARMLDATSAGLDTQVGLNIEVPEVPGSDVLERLAPSLGLVERGNNRFARLGDRGEVVFSLALSDQPNRLTLLLDVPRVPAAVEPWGQLVAVALRAAQRLGGTIVDDGGRALGEEDLIRIAEGLEARYRALDAAGLAAGSRAARRVFN